MKERTPVVAVGSDCAAHDHVGPSKMQAPWNGIFSHSMSISLLESDKSPLGLQMQSAPRMIMRVNPLLRTRSKLSLNG